MAKIDLQEVTFVIPLLVDHPDRAENVSMTYNFLDETFNTTILISEMFHDSPKITSIPVAKTTQLTTPHFHKTRVLNELYKMAKTPIVCRWDSDILIRPEAIVSARDKIMSGEFEAIWPFDGCFYDFDRSKFKQSFMDRDFDKLLLGPGLSVKHEDKGTLISTTSWGAAAMFNFEKYKSAGLENEKILGVGSDDTCSWHRLRQLGRRWGRSYNSSVYHLSHFRGPNSWEKNENAATNDRITNENGLRSKEDLEAEIATWNWCK